MPPGFVEHLSEVRVALDAAGISTTDGWSLGRARQKYRANKGQNLWYSIAGSESQRVLVNGLSALMHLLALQVPYLAAIRYHGQVGRALDKRAVCDFDSSVTVVATFPTCLSPELEMQRAEYNHMALAFPSVAGVAPNDLVLTGCGTPVRSPTTGEPLTNIDVDVVAKVFSRCAIVCSR